MVYSKKLYLYSLAALSAAFLFFTSNIALAATTIDDVGENIILSAEEIPGLITAIAYLIALLLGITGILKLREHVENPNQTPLRVPVIRFLTGGFLLALPIVLEALFVTISGDGGAACALPPWLCTILNFFGITTGMEFTNTGAVSALYTGTGTVINDVLENIIDGISNLPGLVTGVAYLLGLVLCVTGIVKVKDHVENPDRVELKEGVARLLIAGALFALPTMFSAIENTITGGVSITAIINTLLPTSNTYLESTFAPDGASTCGGTITATGGIGATICNFIGATGTSATFLSSLSYLFGLVIGVWAILKIRDHVLNPQQTPIWEGISRLIAAGAFFALPYMTSVIQATISGGGAFQGAGFNLFSSWTHAGAVDTACTSGGPLALDMAMACFMRDIMAPAHILFGHFAFIAGIVFIMIGISRLMKSAQEGARAPGGLGTIMTFITGGILISVNRLVEFFTATISFTTGQTETDAALAYTTGMTAAETQHAEIIIATILQFMIVVGLISFIRGWFIIRDVAEGGQQASLMAGATHVIGGALAINLGPILSAVQQTLGIAGVGITF